MTVKKWKHSGTKKHSMSDREIRNGLLSEKAAEEGIVLLKNDKKILPLNISTKIGLYGAGAGKTVKGGTGSGDVNNRSNISIYQGLKENGIQIVSEKWLANYESIYAEARRAWKEKILEEAKFVENPFDAYAENPFAMPEGRAVTAEDTVDAQTAIYVVSRISGEGKDRRRVEGDYYLSRREREDIRFLDAQKIPTVLIPEFRRSGRTDRYSGRNRKYLCCPEYFPAWTKRRTCPRQCPSGKGNSRRQADCNMGQKV